MEADSVFPAALAAAYPHQYPGHELLERVDALRARLLAADRLQNGLGSGLDL